MLAKLSFRQHCDSRLSGLRSDRLSWWTHWLELATYILPRRYKWLTTPNQTMRGSPINGAILDSTGTLAARTLASGMLSGTSSPTRPWFKLKIEGYDIDDTTDVTLWLAECERRMMRVMQESNFYNMMATMVFDLVIFGTGVAIIEEDFEDVFRGYNPCAGEYYLANSDRMAVDSAYFEFVLTIAQCVQWFGLENCSDAIRSAVESGVGAALQREVAVGHAIEPNDFTVEGGPPKSFAFRELYWEIGSTEGKNLRVGGFHELPFIAPRWDLVANDAYGRSPAMDALGDIKQLQQETKRKAQAIDKMVNPPLVADIQLKNQPASLLPGGVTYVQGMTAGGVGMKPIFTVVPPVAEIKDDIHEVQERIKNIFFNPLFLMISQLDTVRTATEIDARRQEQLILLGPVLERLQNEALGPAVNRIFSIMNRAKLFPPAPREIRGSPIQIDYVSMLAEAQRAVATSGIERWLQLGGNLSAVDPSILDNYDLDETAQEYGRLLNVPPKLIPSDEAIAAKRAARAKAQQEQALLEQTAAAVQGAKTLSETSLAPGSALTALTGAEAA